ncbi:unnamed protein product [Ixodes pacificus]
MVQILLFSFSFQLSVGITLSATGLTRIVTFTPYYFILNNCKTAIEVKEYSENTEWIQVEAGALFSCLVFVQCVALWPKEVQKLELFAKYAKTEECSVPFSCKETNFVLLKIPNKKGGMYMNCQVGESAAVVGFSDYEEGLSPVLMVNHSSMTLSYCQA